MAETKRIGRLNFLQRKWNTPEVDGQLGRSLRLKEIKKTAIKGLNVFVQQM